MFAVIRTGGKQYRVAKDDRIVVESLTGEPGSTVELADVLMIGESGKVPSIGAPVLEKAAVFAEVLEQTRGDKIIVFKKRRRAGYRRKAGHRQNLTVLRITDISADGKPPAKTAAAKAQPKAEAKPQAKAQAKTETKTEARPKAPPKPRKETKPAARAKQEAKPVARPKKKAAKAKSPAKGAKKGSKTSKSKE